MNWNPSDFRTMSKSEMDELFSKMRRGDKRARDALIVGNMKLVIYASGKYAKKYDRDDVIATGAIGLIKAVDTYNAERESFTTYAWACITNEILSKYSRSERRWARFAMFDELPQEDDVDGEGLNIESIAVATDDVEEDVVSRDEKARLYDALSKLDDNERTLIMKRYGIGGHDAMTQEKVGAELMVERPCISKREKKILRKLRRILTDEVVE